MFTWGFTSVYAGFSRMNTSTSIAERPESTAAGVATAPWDRLSARVREFDPGVVVLVARKAPRIREALCLDFGASPLVISDLAIPFVGEYLRGARVAIVDDVVNVGSTIQNALRALALHGATECKAFALAHSAACDALEGLEVYYDSEVPLDREGLRSLAWQTPETLQQLARPYDLDFPIIECSFRSPLRSFTELYAALGERFPDGRVYDLTTRAGSRRGIRRFAIDSVQLPAVHRKVRFYVDEEREICRLVPIQVASALSSGPPRLRYAWPAYVWDAVAAGLSPETSQRPLARLRLFVDSLDYGLDFLAECENLLMPVSDTAFDIDDAELIFGPKVRRTRRVHRFLPYTRGEPVERDSTSEVAVSPFFECADRAGLVEALRLENSGDDPQTAFMRIFERVASLVGAKDPTKYQLRWPYTAAEVLADPYLRLCVGPTFFDLVELVLYACPQLGNIEMSRREVTRLLDRFVDNGGVVPTTAIYEGVVYRIYREGEAGLRDPISDRTLFAWEQFGKPLSLTRVTKLLTFLNYSDDEPGAQIRSDDRGNTFNYRGTVLDDNTEVSRYLLRTDRLKRAGR